MTPRPPLDAYIVRNIIREELEPVVERLGAVEKRLGAVESGLEGNGEQSMPSKAFRIPLLSRFTSTKEPGR